MLNVEIYILGFIKRNTCEFKDITIIWSLYFIS